MADDEIWSRYCIGTIRVLPYGAGHKAFGFIARICCLQKKLEKARFPWPKTEEEAMKLTYDEVHWFLKGIDFFKKHEELKFSANFY